MKRVALILALLAPASLAFGADPKAGEAAYAKSCKNCHGAAGTPAAAMAKMFPTMGDLSSAKVQAISDADMKKVITEGKGKMPASTALSATPDDVVAFVRSLKK